MCVANLPACGCKDFLFLLILCWWLSLSMPGRQESYQVLDFFSGAARISQLGAKIGLVTASYDLNMAKTVGKTRKSTKRKANRRYRPCFDWNGESGYVLFGGNKMACRLAPTPPSATVLLNPRLVLILCLRSRFNEALGSLGTVCSTWTTINQGCSKRSLLCPGGDPSLLANRKGNKMVARTAL